MASEADEIIGLYQRHAQEWARERNTRLFERQWLDRFLSLLPTSPNILDIGCGSGKPIAQYFIDHGCSVSGVDSSPAFINMCEESFPHHHWHLADMRTLSLGRVFNGILAWNSFFHLCHDDQRKMFPIFKKHAAPGAALMFTSGPSHGVAMGTFGGEPLYHASLGPGEYKTQLETHGFVVVEYVAKDESCGRHTIWLAQLR